MYSARKLRCVHFDLGESKAFLVSIDSKLLKLLALKVQIWVDGVPILSRVLEEVRDITRRMIETKADHGSLPPIRFKLT